MKFRPLLAEYLSHVCIRNGSIHKLNNFAVLNALLPAANNLTVLVVGPDMKDLVSTTQGEF